MASLGRKRRRRLGILLIAAIRNGRLFVLTPFLNIKEGWIYYKIRQQDGTFQIMECVDTISNRLFVEWVQIHD